MSEPDRSAASTTTTAPGEPRDDAVARGEVAGLRLEPHRMLGQAQAAGRDLGREAGVLLRVDVVHAAGHHRHGAGGERGAVRLRVDAAGEARDDGEARLARGPAASARAIRRPSEEALRAPTSATSGRASRPASPSAQSSGGASARAARRGG